MATDSRLVVEKGSNCALLEFSAKKLQYNGEILEVRRNWPIMGCQEILSEANYAVLPVWGYSIEQTTL